MVDPETASALAKSMPDLKVRTGSAMAEYTRDEGYARRGVSTSPDVVACPSTVEQVQRLVRFAAERRVPITPWGSGSSLEGQGLAFQGGIVVDLRSMASIRRLLLDDFQVEVEAGMSHEELNRSLRRHGVFFPPNPGAPATIGGMIGNNSSGSRAVKYGVTRDYVARLEVVLADGRLVNLGGRSTKSSSGYDLVDLIVGAEGTLGIVTSAVLRIAPTPEYSRGIVARFHDVAAASSVVQPCLASGIRPASLEMLDSRVIPMMASMSPIKDAPDAVLLIECDGSSQSAVDEEIASISDIVVEAGGWLEPVDPDSFRKIMAARKNLGPKVVLESGMRTVKLVDVAVPLSAFAEAVRAANEVLDEAGLSGFVFGHAGDGNLHVLIASDSRDAEVWARSGAAADEMVRRALALEGTITGEHGIGAAKRHLLRLEHGDAVDLMAAVKHAFDPLGIMNPGKILPEDAINSAGAQR